MSRARNLFDRLAQGQLVALDQLIADREPESLFLDFKRSPADGAGARLADDDNRNLSKGISGFGNSAGGVLVWGVDCRRDANGNELPNRRPLIDAAGFRTRIEGAISRATLPVHTGVQTLSIPDAPGGGSGYVAVLVPQSAHGPLRSIATNHYHLRSGSDFGIVPHDVLAGMFGRKPQPRVAPNFVSRPVRLDRPPWLGLSLRIVAVNFGAVFAERPFLSVWYGNLPPEWVHISIPNRDDYTVRSGLLPAFSVVGNATTVLPPGATNDICDIEIELPRDNAGPFVLDCTMGCSGAEPVRFAFRASGDSIERAVARAARNEQTATSDVLVPDLPPLED